MRTIHSDAIGYIYILSNEAMPNLLKIGWTYSSPELRSNALSRFTGVPSPFKLVHYIAVANPREIERIIHSEIISYRWNDKREFFHIPVDQAVRILDKYQNSENKDKYTKINELLMRYKELSNDTRYLKDIEEPLKYLRMAISLGSSEAAIKASEYLVEKSEIPHSYRVAREYALEAIKMGDPNGYRQLALVY
ncbi:GIY-YIG nuclease family protein, partial [Deinococcus marmoris]|uniref:GIY-YIG nuclease family protein n=1 Tax=Deinococcus marmoris TaxID=249408 RepID=UPI00158E45CE